MTKERKIVILTGAILGLSALILVEAGNPTDMGFCIACFLRDIAGSLHLHQVENLQYARPEIFGLSIGAFVLSLIRGEFKSRSGSNPFIRFFLGFFMMMGALVFLGCPLRMVLRLGSGDGKALLGLIGFVLGIWGGTLFLERGFTLGRSFVQNNKMGYVYPAIIILMTIIAAVGGFFEQGKHAPFFISLGLAIICGLLIQRSRFCMVGGFRDLIMFKDPQLLIGSISLFVVVLVGNILLGNFNFRFSFSIWNILSMALVGLCGALLGGCPLRQLILAGEGNTDSSITVLGMIVGAAISQNFKFASTAAAMSSQGKVMVAIGIAFVVLIGIFGIRRSKNGN